MNAAHATLSFFAVLALAGCTTMQVRTDYDAEVSFTQLSTYDWGDREADASADPAVNSPLLRNLSTVVRHSGESIREQSPV